MEEISRLLPLMIKATGQQENISESACFVAWDLAVGTSNARISAPVQLSNKTLVIATIDATWCKQLEIMAGQILFRLNALLGAPLVTRIHITVNPQWVNQQRQTAEPPPENPLPPPDTELTTVAEHISDASLREQFLRTATRCLNHPPPSTSS